MFFSFEVNLFVLRGKKRVEMSANAQANLVHDFDESPSQYKAVHVAVTKMYAELSGDLNVKIKGPGKLRLSFLPKLILVTKKGICRNDNFHSIFSRCATLTARF